MLSAQAVLTQISYFVLYNQAADMGTKSYSRSLETLNLDWLQEDIG